MKNITVVSISILLAFISVGIECPERHAAIRWDPLSGRVLDTGLSPIPGVKITSALFTDPNNPPTSDFAYSNSNGDFRQQDGFPTRYYESFSCGLEDAIGDWIEFYVIFVHQNYDTTIALFTTTAPNLTFFEQNVGKVDTLIIGPNTYGTYGHLHTIPAIVMKPKN